MSSAPPRALNEHVAPVHTAHHPSRVIGRAGSARVLFAATLIGLGVLGWIYADFALVWQRIPIEHLPARTLLAYLCAAIELLGGIGLLFAARLRYAALVVFVFALLWLVLLKAPAVLVMPQMEATWLGFGEIGVIAAGAWIVFARDANAWEYQHLRFASGRRGIRGARVLYALCLPMIGLSHFFYTRETLAFIPPWMPFPVACVYVTGGGSLFACVALLTGVWARSAALLEAIMLTAITLLVWGPRLLVLPPDRTSYTGFTISLAIAAGAWLVAESYYDPMRNRPSEIVAGS